MSELPSSAPALSPSADMLRYDGQVGAIYKIWIVNFLLCLITLWIYRPWAKTRMRRYIYSRVSLKNERLQYNGTGGELFWGGLKVFGVLFLFFTVLKILEVAALFILAQDEEDQKLYGIIIGGIVAAITYAVFFFLKYFGEYASKRYRLSRTKWRGIRGAVIGDGGKYALAGMGYLLLNVVTLGFIIPRNDMKLRKKLVQDMRLGQEVCTFDENPRDLYKAHLITWVGGFVFLAALAVLLGAGVIFFFPFVFLLRMWYRARLNNQYFKAMRAGPVYFDSTQTGGRLLWLFVGNLLLFITIVGIPFIVHRYASYYARHTKVLGDIEAMKLQQVGDYGRATGDVIGENYEGDFDFDMGII